ncbi:unnamed protein product [Mucor circinelloides]
MSFLPNNNTAFKRRLIKEDPVEEEEEDDCLFENQESENLSEIQVQAKQTSDFMHDAGVEHLKFQPASVIAPPKEASKKARRGHPPKKNASATRSVAESSGSASGSTPTNPLSNLPEFGLVLKAMSLKMRLSTAAAYRKSSKEWQVSVDLSKYVGTRSIVFMFYCHSNWEDFCGENRHRYSVDFRLPLTVGPTEFVLAYFKESVLKRTYKKSISIETNVRRRLLCETTKTRKVN